MLKNIPFQDKLKEVLLIVQLWTTNGVAGNYFFVGGTDYP